LIDSGPNHAPSAERSAECGQVLALCAVFLVVLMGMAAAAIDVGSWYLARRQVQSAADSAALAGASQLAVSWSSAASTPHSAEVLWVFRSVALHSAKGVFPEWRRHRAGRRERDHREPL